MRRKLYYGDVVTGAVIACLLTICDRRAHRPQQRGDEGFERSSLAEQKNPKNINTDPESASRKRETGKQGGPRGCCLAREDERGCMMTGSGEDGMMFAGSVPGSFY